MNPYKKLVFILCCFATGLMASQSYAALEIEPNDTTTQANALSPGVPMTGQISSGSDKDYFKIATNGAGIISLQFDANRNCSGFCGGWKVSIINTAGNVLTSITCGSGASCNNLLQAGVGFAGIYYPVVEPIAGFLSENYTLTVTGDVITTIETQSPTVPAGLSATAVNSSQINLAWTASTDNIGVTVYKVYRGGFLIATLGNVTSYSNTGLTALTTYSYTVQACDAAGNCSAQSAAATATTQGIPVNGSCGSANGVSSAVAPSSGLCSSGAASVVTNDTTQWAWTCAGNGVPGSTNASCSAPRTATPPPTVSTGPYDGIWSMTYQGTSVGYLTVQENNGIVVAVWLASDNASWAAFLGPRTGNTVNLSTIVGGLTAQVTGTFTTLTTFTGTQVSCVANAGWQCVVPNGATVQGVKIW